MTGGTMRASLLALAVALSGAHASAGDIDDAAMSDESNTGEWLAYGRTHSEQRFSPLAQIQRSNVSRLKVDWFIDLPDAAGLEYNEYFQIGRGNAYGAELMINKTRGRLHGFLAYTVSVTRRRFPQINLVDGRPRNYPPKYDRRHDLRLIANYQLSRTWRATGVFTYATGQAYTEPTAQYKLLGGELLTGEEAASVLCTYGLNLPEGRLC